MTREVAAVFMLLQTNESVTENVYTQLRFANVESLTHSYKGSLILVTKSKIFFYRRHFVT